MNLRKRPIFEVEDIHKQLKNARFKKKESTTRKKLKNALEVGVMIHRVHASNDSLYEAAEDLVTSRRKYHGIKIKLRSLLAEKEQIREDVCHKKNNLQKITTELRRVAADLKTLDVNDLNEHEAAVVNLNSWLVEEDIIEAWRHIDFAEEDLRKDNTCHMKRSKKDACRTLNSVSVPNVLSNGVISLNGSINISRNKCCICLEQRVNAVLYKCGHFCMCFNCATELANLTSKKCPVCRTEIVDVIKTYL